MLCQSSGELEEGFSNRRNREGRSEVKRGEGKIRTYLPTEPPSVAHVEEGLEGIDWC
jgi:hypothetical protein